MYVSEKHAGRAGIPLAEMKGQKEPVERLKKGSLLRHIEEPTVNQHRFVRDLIFWPPIIGGTFACLPVPLQAPLEHDSRVLFGSGK